MPKRMPVMGLPTVATVEEIDLIIYFCKSKADIDNEQKNNYIHVASGKSRQASRSRAKGPIPQSLFFGGYTMYLCYIDESGTPQIPGNTSHYILAGISIPIWHWKTCDREIDKIKEEYSLSGVEIHAAWMLRKYIEQDKIPDLRGLPIPHRRSKVESIRKSELLRLQKVRSKKHYYQTKKNYRKTDPYIHLTYTERCDCIREIARCISNWGYARLFAECVDKIFFDPNRTSQSVDEQAFEQVVSRFERYLQIIGTGSDIKPYGLLIHDNNETVSKKHTRLMKQFHKTGTLWTVVENIIETPMFVDSQLTSMVQIADLCSYALRRYLENNETELFDFIFNRADKKDETVVGIRHFTQSGCACKICHEHNPPPCVS